MRSYKYILNFVLIFAVVSVFIGRVISLLRNNIQAAFLFDSAALVILLGITLYHFLAVRELDTIIDFLGQKRRECVKTRFPLLKKLCNAINEYTAALNKRIADIDQNLNVRDFQLKVLERKKADIEAVIYSIRDAVIVTDALDRVVMANDAAKRIFNFELDPDKLSVIDKLIENPIIVGLVRQGRQEPDQHLKQEIILEFDSEQKVYDCIISSINDDLERFCGLVAVLHDITREKEIAQMKTDFVSHVSHELKTPLASIRAYSEMLVDGEARDENAVTQFCSVIQNQSERLNSLIEDILNVSKIESNLISAQKTPVSLEELCREAAKMLVHPAQEKNITVEVRNEASADLAYADREMLLQVIINLVSNAIKYSRPDSRIELILTLCESDHTLRLEVIDEGLGLTAQELEHVFEKFYRAESTKKFAEGTGLGLNLVRQIVEKFHGGKVFARSQPGRGSTFGFDLPVAEYANKSLVR